MTRTSAVSKFSRLWRTAGTRPLASSPAGQRQDLADWKFRRPTAQNFQLHHGLQFCAVRIRPLASGPAQGVGPVVSRVASRNSVQVCQV